MVVRVVVVMSECNFSMVEFVIAEHIACFSDCVLVLVILPRLLYNQTSQNQTILILISIFKANISKKLFEDNFFYIFVFYYFTFIGWKFFVMMMGLPMCDLSESFAILNCLE